MDVRAETGIETYVNDEPGDPNPGIIVDALQNRGRALTSSQARALAEQLIAHANYFESLQGSEHRMGPCPECGCRPGPYQPGSHGETDENGRMVWRWADHAGPRSTTA